LRGCVFLDVVVVAIEGDKKIIGARNCAGGKKGCSDGEEKNREEGA
jgi:hypothetical protein